MKMYAVAIALVEWRHRKEGWDIREKRGVTVLEGNVGMAWIF
jgi:hypothetical protein